MALSAFTVAEVRAAGSDTACGGLFDPSQTAGMFTDGAATSATGNSPIFTSASYNFVAGDAGAWVYVGAGTNWKTGWYNIVSVASNAATLDATIGRVMGSTGGSSALTTVPSTTAGCATTASPTGATWTIDYSQQNAARYAYTDLASVGTGLTVSTIQNGGFGGQQVGNSLVITGGTNFNTGRYVIASVAATVATVIGPTNITTGAGVSGAGRLGGGFASPGKALSVLGVGTNMFIASSTYTFSTGSSNVAGGVLVLPGGSSGVPFRCEGYRNYRGDKGIPPTLLIPASSVTSVNIVTISTSASILDNFILDGASKAGIRGVSVNSGAGHSLVRVTAQNCTDYGFVVSAYCKVVLCEATGISGGAAGFYGDRSDILFEGCYSHDNTVPGFYSGPANFRDCITDTCTDGFSIVSAGNCVGCCSYGNSGDGFKVASGIFANMLDCITESNGGYGYNAVDFTGYVNLQNCSDYNNTSGRSLNISNDLAPLTATASQFVNAASGDFRLNNTAGAGAIDRASGVVGQVTGGGSTVGYRDRGAVQHQDTGGAGLALPVARII